MEDLKWLLRRCGLPILLLLILVIAGVFCWGKMHAEKKKVAEEVWEPPVEIENSDAETEEAENTETSTDSAYWFIPQASDDLLSEEEKEQILSDIKQKDREMLSYMNCLSRKSGIWDLIKRAERQGITETQLLLYIMSCCCYMTDKEQYIEQKRKQDGDLDYIYSLFQKIPILNRLLK